MKQFSINCHPRVGGDLGVGYVKGDDWIPACAGMTVTKCKLDNCKLIENCKLKIENYDIYA